jgi:hypothetical protein
MVLKSEGRIWLPNKTMRGGARIYVTADVVLDSQFPFKEDGKIVVEIDPESRILKIKPFQEGQDCEMSERFGRTFEHRVKSWKRVSR